MAFTVEDGTGIQAANAYIAVAFADTYHADRGHGSWAAFDNTKKQQCIIRATDYIDKRFGRRFRGMRNTKNQGLEWPRLNAYDNDRFLLADIDEIPRQLSKAVAEYALRAGMYGELAPDPIPVVPRQDLSPADPEIPTEFTGGQVSRVSEKVDVLEETKSFMTPAAMASVGKNKTPLSGIVTDAMIPEYPAADLLLEELLMNKSRRLSRG